jgi:predicted  nucleic acid-binding Zn-ribbon protein
MPVVRAIQHKHKLPLRNGVPGESVHEMGQDKRGLGNVEKSKNKSPEKHERELRDDIVNKLEKLINKKTEALQRESQSLEERAQNLEHENQKLQEKIQNLEHENQEAQEKVKRLEQENL